MHSLASFAPVSLVHTQDSSPQDAELVDAASWSLLHAVMERVHPLLLVITRDPAAPCAPSGLDLKPASELTKVTIATL